MSQPNFRILVYPDRESILESERERNRQCENIIRPWTDMQTAKWNDDDETNKPREREQKSSHKTHSKYITMKICNQIGDSTTKLYMHKNTQQKHECLVYHSHRQLQSAFVIWFMPVHTHHWQKTREWVRKKPDKLAIPIRTRAHSIISCAMSSRSYKRQSESDNDASRVAEEKQEKHIFVCNWHCVRAHLKTIHDRAANCVRELNKKIYITAEYVIVNPVIQCHSYLWLVWRGFVKLFSFCVFVSVCRI